jgi:hypothetical protein
MNLLFAIPVSILLHSAKVASSTAESIERNRYKYSLPFGAYASETLERTVKLFDPFL